VLLRYVGIFLQPLFGCHSQGCSSKNWGPQARTQWRMAKSCLNKISFEFRMSYLVYLALRVSYFRKYYKIILTPCAAQKLTSLSPVFIQRTQRTERKNTVSILAFWPLRPCVSCVRCVGRKRGFFCSGKQADETASFSFSRGFIILVK